MPSGVNVGKAVGYLDLDTSGFKKGFSSALSDLQVFKDETASSSNKMAALGSSVQSTGKAMTMGVTVPLLGIAAASVKVGNDFEAQMDRVGAIS